MNEQNFLKRLDFLATGDGIVREVPVPLGALINTNGTALALSSNIAVVALQDDNDSVTFNFQVPIDYDESNDALAVCLTAQLTTGDKSAGSNIVELDLDQVKYVRPGAAAAVDLSSSVTSDSQSIDDVAAAQYVWDLSGLGLKPGDCLSIEIDAQETGTAEVSIYGASIRYKSDIVANDIRLRGGVTETITNA